MKTWFDIAYVWPKTYPCQIVTVIWWGVKFITHVWRSMSQRSDGAQEETIKQNFKNGIFFLKTLIKKVRTNNKLWKKIKHEQM